MLYNIPSSGGIFLAYIIPAYLLAGLHREDAEEPLFSGGTLLGKVFFQYIGMLPIDTFKTCNLKRVVISLILFIMD